MPDPTPPTQAAPSRPDHHGPTVNHPDERKRPRWRRRLLRLAFFLFLLIVVLVVAGPKLLSTGPGTRMLLAQVNSRVDGHLEVRDLTLAWFSGPHAQDVKYVSADGMHEVSVRRVDLPDTSLWALATGGRELGRIKARDLDGVTIEPMRGDATPTPDDDQATPSPPDRSAAPAEKKPGWAAGLSFDLEVDGLSWRYHAPDSEPVDVVSSGLALTLRQDGGAHLLVAGAVTQGDESGRFDFDMAGDSLVDLDGRFQLGLADYDITATVQQVPVDAIARVLSGRTYTNAVLAHVLGEPERVALLLGGASASGEVRIDGTPDAMAGLVRLHTDHLDTDIALTRSGEMVTLGDATTFRLELSPDAFAALLPDRDLTLESPVTLTCVRPGMTLPLVDGAPGVDAMTLRAVVNSGDWLLTDAEGQRITLAAPKLGFASEALGIELMVLLDGVAHVIAEGETDTGGAEPTPTTARLKIMDLLSDQRAFAMRATDVPTAVVEWAYGGAGGLAAAVGPTVQSVVGRVEIADGRASGGTLAVNWDASTDAPADGALAVLPPIAFAIDELGLITVPDGKDIELRLEVTEALGDHWLGQINPILFDAKSADRPVRIVLDGATFAYPLGDPDFVGALIDASLDLGNVQFGQQSLFAYIFEWTGHAGEPASFLPASISLRGNELRYDELGLDIGNVRVQFQGAVDLVERSLTEMSVRVPSESLLTVFQDLEGVVEPGDALIIPMRGGIRDPEVDMEAFRADLVRLGTAAPRRAAERELNRVFERAREAVEGELGAEGGDFAEDVLRSLLGGRGEQESPADEGADDDRGGSFAEDVLRNLLGGRR